MEAFTHADPNKIMVQGVEPPSSAFSTASIRADILDKAKDCVCGHREQDYGSPEDNFAIIAHLWSAYLGCNVSSVDVAMMMSLLKIARIKTGSGTEDSFIDLAGYAACAGEIAHKQECINANR